MRAIPGFRLTMGATLLWLGIIVLIPLALLIVTAASLGPAEFWRTVWTPRAVAAYRLTFGAALVAAAFNGVAGLLLAWVLVRYRFPGRNFFDAVIDIPFALPTAVAGLAFASLLTPLHLAHTRIAIGIVLIFVSLPFVVRAVQPVLEDLGAETEEAAHSLGATRGQTFRWVIFPALLPALLTGMALSFARAVGEYGSIVFVSGNIPFKTEAAPLLIMGKLEEFNFAGAAAIAVVLLAASFAVNGLINLLSRWSRRHA